MKRATSLILALILCVGLLSGLSLNASAETLQERQQAVVTLAWAYYDKGHSVQYDGATIVPGIDRTDIGKTRSTNQVAPEYATPNETMYTVCSDFPHQVYWQAFGYSIKGNAGSCWTGGLMNIGTEKDTKTNPQMSIYHWEAEKNPDVPITEALEKIISVLQPGDVFTLVRKGGTGHTELYVGPVMDDGKNYILHSDGARINVETKKDSREYKSKEDPLVDPRFGVAARPKGNGGTILLTEAEPALRNLANKKGDGTIVKLNVVRPLVDMTEEKYPITTATKYRMSHPRLAIDRTLNKTRFNSAYTGETVTMTLKLSNSSKGAYSVPVTEKTPAGAKLKTPFAGAKVSGDTQTFDVQLGAGESKTFTCEYEITAARGEQVIFKDGSVGDIPSNVIPITVGGAKLTDADKALLAAAAKGDYNQVLKDAKATADKLGDAVYQKILGLNVELPSYSKIIGKFVKATKTTTDKDTNVFVDKSEVKAEDLQAFQMMVPTFRWGRNIWLKYGDERCSDPRDMHVEPGDVIVRSDDVSVAGKSEQLVYLGEGKYLFYDGKAYTIAEEPELVASLLSDIYYVLRPTLAYDDIHTLAGTAAAPTGSGFKFTDVKESDWFYTYVKDLVADGTVNGMTETTFVPNGTLTFGQALKLIGLAVGEKEPAKSGTHWASGWLTLAKSKGWIGEEPSLDGTITRLQLCRIAAKAKGLTAVPEKNPFTDTADADVLALNKAGVINGMTATEFQPEGQLTRAQISKIIWTLRKV